MVRDPHRGLGALAIAFGAAVVIMIGVGSRHAVAKETAAIKMLAARVTGDSAAAAIILIFRREDCASMRTVTLSLSQQSIVPVIGAVVGSEAAVDSVFLARKFGIYFPVRRVGQRAAAALVRGLGYTSTPLMLAVTSDGRIVGARAPRSISDVLELAKWAASR